MVHRPQANGTDRQIKQVKKEEPFLRNFEFLSINDPIFEVMVQGSLKKISMLCQKLLLEYKRKTDIQTQHVNTEVLINLESI